MEIQLKRISHDANEYDVRKAVELVLHGPEFYDKNDEEFKGRKPNFLVEMGKEHNCGVHDGTAILRVTRTLGRRLLQWNYDSKDKSIVVCGRPLLLFNNHQDVKPDVRQTLERARYIDPEHDRLYNQRKDYASQVRLRIANVQIGVWHKNPNEQSRAFSVEYDRECLHPSAAYITVVYEHSLIRIEVSAALSLDARITDRYLAQMGQRETEEDCFLILIKYTSIKKLGTGCDEWGKPCAYFHHRCCVRLRRSTLSHRI